MPSPIPDNWGANPPHALAVGDGPYTTVLAACFGAAAFPAASLKAGAQLNARGGHTRLLEDLERVFLVVPEDMQPAEALHCHRLVWNLVEQFSSAGEQHDLAFLFVLPADAPRNYEQILALGLAVPEINPATTGHAVCRRSVPFSELLSLAASTVPRDLPPLRARQARDLRHSALAHLRAAISQDNPSAAVEAARHVLAAFSGQEYQFDQFCRPPSHRHGKLLRAWLSSAVTSGVTPDSWTLNRQQIADWLA